MDAPVSSQEDSIPNIYLGLEFKIFELNLIIINTQKY
jgi:hypothetical protein